MIGATVSGWCAWFRWPGTPGMALIYRVTLGGSCMYVVQLSWYGRRGAPSTAGGGGGLVTHLVGVRLTAVGLTEEWRLGVAGRHVASSVFAVGRGSGVVALCFCQRRRSLCNVGLGVVTASVWLGRRHISSVVVTHAMCCCKADSAVPR